MAQSGQGGPGRRATLRAVAERAGVSTGTVSRVMNNQPGVDEQLRAGVLEIAAQLGYVPPVRGTTRRLGMYLREVESSADNYAYFSNIVHGAQAECRRRGWQLVYGSIGEGPQALLQFSRAIQGTQFAGLILENLLRREVVEAALRTAIPVVVVDDEYVDLPIDSVDHDAYGGALLAMRYLLVQGHRRIGLLAGPVEHVNIRRRIAAYRDALGEAGIAYDATLVANCDLSVEGGEHFTAELLARPSAACLTALLCSNDCTAIGALRTLRAVGIRVPEDLSVMGFDDIQSARLVSPPLTTVRVATEEVGAAAVQAVIDRLHAPQRPYSTRLLHTSLVVRESVSRPRATSLSFPALAGQNGGDGSLVPAKEVMTTS